MSEFEYLSVLISIVVGLGMTQILSGFARSIHRRSTTPLDPVHTIWTCTVFLILILNWWVFFQAQEYRIWTFGLFLTVVIWAVLHYGMAVLLYPQDMEEGEGYGEVWTRNRPWILGAFALSVATDILLTWQRGDLLDPPWYLPFAGHLLVLGVVGALVSSRRFHMALGTYVFFVGLTWSLGVRRLLGI